MSIGTLYIANDGQASGKVIRAVGAITGTEFSSPSSYTHYETNKTPEFTAKFGYGKVPALDANGFYLTEGIAIARYVATKAGNKQLLGTTPEETALVDQWQNFAYTELFPPLGRLRGLYSHSVPYNKPLETALKGSIDRALEYLNTYLNTHTFLATERLTVADLAIASTLFGAFETYIDSALRTKLPNLQRYYETVANQPKVQAVFGTPSYVEKAVGYVPPAKEEKPKAEKAPKAAPAPKAEKPKKAAEEDDEEDEPLVPAEPKTKNPLDDLPKSTFNLEDWKRAYSNKETRGAGGAVEWFYENYDPAGYSVWRVDFKYNQELTQVFMSSNQIGGFFNRLEGSRKYLFGSMGVLGTNNDSILSGILILRGPEHKPVVEVAPDWESYTYKELKVTGPEANEEDKKYFEAALAWDLEVDGKKWADGKNFK